MSVQLRMTDKFVPDKPVAPTFAGLTVATSSRKGFRVERPDANTLVIVRRYTPGWAVFLAIVGLLVFLLGLLFLLVKTEQRVTIVGYDVDGGGRYTVAGATDAMTADLLEAELRPAT